MSQMRESGSLLISREPLRRFTNLRSRVLLALGAVLLTSCGLEIVFRVTGLRARYLPSRMDFLIPGETLDVRYASHGGVPFATIRSRYASNMRGTLGTNRVVDHVLNSRGWRDVEHSVTKPARTYRILGLGDSYLFGQGVEFREICLNRLGELLAKQFPEQTVEVINTGVSGYNTADELRLLEDCGLAYQPDLVILHFVLNDVEPDLTLHHDHQVEFFVNFTSIFQQPDWLSQHSELWGFLRQRTLESLTARNYIHDCLRSFEEDSSKWEQCRKAILEIRNRCQETKTPLFIVIFPFFYELDRDYPFQPIHEVVHRFCETEAIPVLDLRDNYRQYRGPEMWVDASDPHPNARAHAIAAQAIAADLLSRPQLFGLRSAGSSTATR